MFDKHDGDGDGRIAIVTLNRPNVNNCFNQQTCEELAAAWRRLAADEVDGGLARGAARDPLHRQLQRVSTILICKKRGKYNKIQKAN